MKTELFGVDVGRSAVKYAGSAQGDFEVDSLTPSCFSLSASATSDADQLSAINDTRLEVLSSPKIKGTFLLGKVAEMKGVNPIYPLENTALATFSTVAVLYQLAIKKVGQAIVAINLTFTNHFQKQFFKDYLLGKHTVALPGQKPVDIHIEKVFVLYQGYSALLDVAFDDKYVVQPDYTSGKEIIIDVGRQTVDVSYVDRMSVISGVSWNLGMSEIYSRIISKAQSAFNQPLNQAFIEENVNNNVEAIPFVTGGSFPLKKYLGEAAKSVADELKLMIDSFLMSNGIVSVDHILLTGGGARFFFDYLKAVYPSLAMSDLYGNARGMYKYLKRLEKEGAFK